jgi:hypothetical protein
LFLFLLLLLVSRSDDTNRVCFALVAHYAMLADPDARSKLVLNKRLATGLLQLVATRGGQDSKWVSACWVRCYWQLQGTLVCCCVAVSSSG